MKICQFSNIVGGMNIYMQDMVEEWVHGCIWSLVD